MHFNILHKDLLQIFHILYNIEILSMTFPLGVYIIAAGKKFWLKIFGNGSQDREVDGLKVIQKIVNYVGLFQRKHITHINAEK